MSYKYLNEHPRGYYQWGKEEKKNGSFRGNGVEHNVCNCIQKSNFTFIHISMCNCSSFSTNTAYNAIDKRKKKKKKKHGVAIANRISS